MQEGKKKITKMFSLDDVKNIKSKLIMKMLFPPYMYDNSTMTFSC